MYINNLGMRDEVSQRIAASINAANTADTRTIKASDTSKTGTTKFPTAMKNAVESQAALFSENKETSLRMEEALARLKNDPEWEDVGTALSALYKNQQQMQVQMSLLSAGYSSGLSSYSQYGLGTSGTSAYAGIAGLLGSSIFGNQLI